MEREAEAHVSSSYWTYQAATPTPRFEDVPAGAFNGTQAQWEAFSPGMRREIVRDFNRRAAVVGESAP